MKITLQKDGASYWNVTTIKTDDQTVKIVLDGYAEKGDKEPLVTQRITLTLAQIPDGISPSSIQWLMEIDKQVRSAIKQSDYFSEATIS